MRNELKIAIVIILAGITIYGLVTGKFLFLFLWLPLGFLFRSNKNSK